MAQGAAMSVGPTWFGELTRRAHRDAFHHLIAIVDRTTILGAIAATADIIVSQRVGH